MARELIVKVTCGEEAPERLNQGLTVAATAAASGVPVSLWLTGDAVWFSTTERAPVLDLPLATPASELIATVLEFGQLTACGQCVARRALNQPDLLPGTRIAGAAVFVEESLREGAQALVY